MSNLVLAEVEEKILFRNQLNYSINLTKNQQPFKWMLDFQYPLFIVYTIYFLIIPQKLKDYNPIEPSNTHKLIINFSRREKLFKKFCAHEKRRKILSVLKIKLFL